MPKRRGNGWDAQTFDVLVEIRDEMRRGFGDLNAQIRIVNERLDRLETGLRAVNDRLDSGLRAVNDRLDRVIENTGAHWRDLDRRVQAIEEAGRATGR